MTSARPPVPVVSAPSIKTWIVVLGATGFAAGFFGPMLLSPQANQGPMLGIFITGPGGLLCGAVLGMLARVLDAARARLALLVAAASLALVTLYFSTPEPERVAEALDAQVVQCSSPLSLQAEAFAEWDRQTAKVRAAPRAGWKDDFPRMVEADPGVVLELVVRRHRTLYENRKPWNRGSRFASAWSEAPVPSRYFARFAGADCGAYPQGRPALYLTQGEASSGWPSEKLSVFLGLQLIAPLPLPLTPIVGR
jgi:hypothetical protein